MFTSTNSQLRILMTTDARGPLWRQSAALARTLARRGTSVTLTGWGRAPDPDQRLAAERNGVTVTWISAQLDTRAPAPAELRRAAAELDRLILKRAPDVAHLHAPVVAAHLPRRSLIVVSAHSCLASWWRAVNVEAPPPDRAWHVAAAADGLATADAVIAPTQTFADELTRIYGPRNHLYVIAPGGEGIAPAEKLPQALAAGDWRDEASNLSVLDAAAAECGWPVLLTGPPPAAEPDAAVHAVALGELTAEAERQEIARSAVVVSASLYDSFGLPILEAANAGAALVLSDIPSYRELWDSCALFADPTNPAAIADAINLLARDAATRTRIGAAARRRAARYSLETQADALCTLYSETAGRQAGAA